MPIKKEKLDSIKGYREYQKKSGAAAAVSSPAPSSYAPAQKPARVKQAKREQIYTYYQPVSTPKMTAQEKNIASMPAWSIKTPQKPAPKPMPISMPVRKVAIAVPRRVGGALVMARAFSMG